MEKVKLPREVAEALDKSRHMGSVAIMAHIASLGDEEEMPTTEELWLIHSFYKKNPYLIACALVNGYEVEHTPEEKAADYITRLRNMRDHTYTDPAKQRELNIEVSGAIQVLEYLNIKITGVND